MKKDIQRMADERKIILYIQRRKEGRKEGREGQRKEERKRVGRQGRNQRDSTFWSLLPLCPTYEHINKKSWCTLLSDSRKCKLHKFVLWADSLLLHPLTTIKIPPCSPHTASVCKLKNLFIPSLVYDVISLDTETKSQVMST